MYVFRPSDNHNGFFTINTTVQNLNGNATVRLTKRLDGSKTNQKLKWEKHKLWHKASETYRTWPEKLNKSLRFEILGIVARLVLALFDFHRGDEVETIIFVSAVMQTPCIHPLTVV